MHSCQQFCFHSRVPEAPNSTRILLSNVKCMDDDEGHILRCDFSQSISQDCSHKIDIALQCCKCHDFEKDIRKLLTVLLSAVDFTKSIFTAHAGELYW